MRKGASWYTLAQRGKILILLSFYFSGYLCFAVTIALIFSAKAIVKSALVPS